MASPLLTRAPCLGCLRKITQANSASVTPFFAQMRKKSGKSARPKDSGVIVRLLRDMRGFGREGAIFRAERGRMRDQWYPSKKAEYMTRARLKELGLTKNDIGERDPMFGTQIEMEEDLVDDAVEAVAGLSTGAAAAVPRAAAEPALEPPSHTPAVEIEHVAPNRALELLTTLIPGIIVFERHLKHLPPIGGLGAALGTSSPSSAPKPAASEAPEQPKVLSPLERRRAKMLEAQKAPEPAKSPEELDAERKAAEEAAEKERRRAEEEAEKRKEIHGSVSLRDVADFIKDKMLLDPEASRIHVQAEDIRFLGLPEGADKVEKVGTFEIEIRTHVGKDKVEPVRRVVDVVPT